MPAVPKPFTWISKEYRRFIKSKKCCVCGAPSDDAHHLKSKGAGGDDLQCVPMCRGHHTEYHHDGRDKLEAKYSINLEEIRIKCLESFVLHPMLPVL